MNFVTLEIVRESADKLTQEVWGFHLVDFDLTLNSYNKVTRPSTRHKYREGFGYSRLSNRLAEVQERDVPWPADVVAEARNKFLALVESKLRVGRWHMDLGR